VLNAAAQYVINVPGDVLEASGDTMTDAAQLAAEQKYDWAFSESQFSDVSGAFTATPADPATALSSTNAATFATDTASFAAPATEVATATELIGDVAEPLLAFSVGTMIGAGGARLFGFKDDEVCAQQSATLTTMAAVLDGVDCSAWDDALSAEQRNLDANRPVLPDACVSGVGCWTFTGAVAEGGAAALWCFSGPSEPVYVLFAQSGQSTDPLPDDERLSWTPNMCGASAEMEMGVDESNPIVQYQFMNDQPPFQLSDVETVGTTGPNPTRNWVCTITTTTGSVLTKSSENWTETDAEVAPIECPGLPLGQVAASMTITEHGGDADQQVWNENTTNGYQNWASLYPECTNGSCPLILNQLTLNQSGQSCFDVGVGCDGWIDDPDRDTDYTCTYGTHTISLSECFVYGDIFNPADQANGYAYSNPSNGAPLDTPTSPTDVDAIESSLIHRTAAVSANYNSIPDYAQAVLAVAEECDDEIDIEPTGIQQYDDIPIVKMTLEDCENLAIYSPGQDVPAAEQHDFDAIGAGQSPVLHYMNATDKAARGTSSGWYTAVQYNNCGLGSTPAAPNTECDEYPFFSTAEGGPGASLRQINADDNGRQGNQLKTFYSQCGLNGSGPSNEFIVAPNPCFDSIGFCTP
jgi:hypothetical protein